MQTQKAGISLQGQGVKSEGRMKKRDGKVKEMIGMPFLWVVGGDDWW